jgi:PQQ-dependent dehydrogenase (methanol/ethanol family)
MIGQRPFTRAPDPGILGPGGVMAAPNRFGTIMTCRLRNSLIAAALLLPVAASAQSPGPACCEPTAADSPKVGGNYGNTGYSSLSDIDRKTVAGLGAAWHLRAEGGDDRAFQQGNAVAAGGVVYVETTQGSVLAVDGATGAVKWRYKPEFGQTLRRGVALGEGKVFTLTAGNRAVALDQATGKPVWEKAFSADRQMGTMPTAVTYYDGKIFFGTANSSRGVGLALRASDGEELWRFYGAPSAGDYGSDTWAGESWKTGGAAPWQHPAVDPELGLIYWTFGNPRAGGPLDGSTREGANLFANSIVAIDPNTGQRVWHFQSIHHDIWDMDNVMAPVLLDLAIDGKTRKAVIYGSKTGMLYILDRKTGEALHPIVEKPVPQEPRQHTWATQPYTSNAPLVELCPTGKGVGRVPPHYKPGCLFEPHWDEPVVHLPAIGGGADTSQFSYSARTRLLYVGVGIIAAAQTRSGPSVGLRPAGALRSGRLVAYDPAKGKIAWSKPMEWSLAHGNGALSTAGDVLFIGQPDGYLLALDARNGRELWRFQTGAGVHTSPVTYEAGGEQYVAVFSGGNGLPYNSPKGDHLWAFKLGGKQPPAPTPAPPPKRQPITTAAVAGAAVNNTITLGRIWANDAVGAAESSAPNAVAPQVLEVGKGATVTFLNPVGNSQDRCATQFFEGLFGKTPLKPGESFRYTFKTSGEYFFNDCASPFTTGKVVVR